MNVNKAIDKHNLVALQNHPANVNRDHLTICAFFTTDADFYSHAHKLQAFADKYDADNK